jgi:PAS domain-containing protein
MLGDQVPGEFLMSEPRLAAPPVPIDRARGHGAEAQNTELFRLLVETVRDYAIFVLDPEGYVLTWNPGAEAMKGYVKKEIVGKHFSAFIFLKQCRAAGPSAN